MSIRTQKDIIGYALKREGWHDYVRNSASVEAVCASVSLGILKVNEHGQFALRSHEKAMRFLGGAA
jgi:hypothetical protein